jgi:hypothetical protein
LSKYKIWFNRKKGKIKAFIKKWIMFFLNPRFLVCFLIGWLITNGWSYIFAGLGAFFGINWMTIVGTAYMSMLWAPFTPEKIITLILAIFFLKFLFPKDQKTLKVLQDELQKAKDSLKKQKEKRKKKARLEKKNKNKCGKS